MPGIPKGVSKVAFFPDGQQGVHQRGQKYFLLECREREQAARGFPAGTLKQRHDRLFSRRTALCCRFLLPSGHDSLEYSYAGQVEASLTDDHKLDDAAVRFSPDGRLIAVSATDKVSLRDAARQKIRSFGGDVQGINLAFFSADQEQVKIAGNEELAVFDRRQGRLTGRCAGPSSHSTTGGRKGKTNGAIGASLKSSTRAIRLSIAEQIGRSATLPIAIRRPTTARNRPLLFHPT